MKIIVAGGSGLIGEALNQYLANRGDQVWVLSRHPEKAQLPEGVQVVRWNGRTPVGWSHLLEEADAIINLSGTNVGARPWTNERKRLLRSSRVESGQAIVEALHQSAKQPEVIVQMVGINYYGIHQDEVIDENSPVGQDFLGQLAEDWEAAIRPAADLGVRLVTLRAGVVLTPKGGVLAPFVYQNQLFAGGPLGGGRQWISWIHIRDLLHVIDFALSHPEVQGPLNATSPEPVTNAEFGRTVSKVMHRPYWAPVPAFALKLILGEMSTVVLDGLRALPRRLLDMGFQFEFPHLEGALEDLLVKKV